MSQTQVGGDHYTKLGITPFSYSMANGLDAMQHTAIKYITRFRDKNGIIDLEKARDTIDQLIEYESLKVSTTTPEEVMASAKSAPDNGIIINEFEGFVELLKMIKSNEVKYERIITTGRGGLWLAAQVAYALELNPPTICSKSDLHLYVHNTTLFVDSIVDTGATIEHVKVDVACLIKREGSKGAVKYYVNEVPESVGYVYFPVGQFADNDYQDTSVQEKTNRNKDI